jgi:hypothetical protein
MARQEGHSTDFCHSREQCKQEERRRCFNREIADFSKSYAKSVFAVVQQENQKDVQCKLFVKWTNMCCHIAK